MVTEQMENKNPSTVKSLFVNDSVSSSRLFKSAYEFSVGSYDQLAKECLDSLR